MGIIMNSKIEEQNQTVSPLILGISLSAAIFSLLVLFRVLDTGKGPLAAAAAGFGSLVFVAMFVGVLVQKIRTGNTGN